MVNEPNFDKQINFCAHFVVAIVPDHVKTTLELLNRLLVRATQEVCAAKLVVDLRSPEKVR